MSDLLKGFKKVGSTDTHTTFQHKDGHILHVANKSLDGAKKSEMRAIPERKMAQGGETQEDGPISKETADEFSRSLGMSEDLYPQPSPSPAPQPERRYAGGGSVEEQMQQAQSGAPYEPTADVGDQSNPAQPMDLSNAGTPTAPQQPQAPAQAQVVEPNDPMSGLPGYEDSKQALRMGAANEADIGQRGQDIYANQIKQNQQYEQRLRGTMAYMQKDIDAISSDIKTSHINPNHYLENMGTGRKITTAIGLLLGGMAQGFGSSSNPAMEFLKGQIERDLDSQKANIGKKENLLGALQKQYGNRMAAEDMFRVIRANTMANELGQLGATAKSAQAKQNMYQGLATLHQTYAPMAQRAAALKVADDMNRQGNGSSNESASAQLSSFLVPKEQQKEASHELGIAHKTMEAHQAVDDIVNNIAKLQTVGNRTMSPIQSKQQIDAYKAQLIPLVLEASPSKRLTHEVLKAEIEPFMPGLTSDGKTVENFRKQLHRVVDTHADATPTLNEYRVPVPRYGGDKSRPQSAMDKLGQSYKLNPSTGKYRR